MRAMARDKTVYTCTACGGTNPKWLGKCPHCGEWNTLEEGAAENNAGATRHRYKAATPMQPVATLSQIEATEIERTPTGLGELDRVLGGGLVEGGVVLIGGDPGIGKSTLLLQALAQLSQRDAGAVRHRRGIRRAGGAARAAPGPARRADARAGRDPARAHPRGGRSSERPSVLRDRLDPDACTPSADVGAGFGGPGARVRGAADALSPRRAAPRSCWSATSPRKARIAGPRVLEHMVDTVLYFEGDTQSASGWCARSRTASARSTRSACSR